MEHFVTKDIYITLRELSLYVTNYLKDRHVGLELSNLNSVIFASWSLISFEGILVLFVCLLWYLPARAKTAKAIQHKPECLVVTITRGVVYVYVLTVWSRQK